MKTGPCSHLRRCLSLAVVGILAVSLTACTGRGGGQLPPDKVRMFNGSASFGFSFGCEDSGGLNPSTGRLHFQLSYTDHGSNPIGSAFSINGIVDTFDPVLESQFCIGDNPPEPPPNPPYDLIFLGRYRLTSSPPAGFPSTCPTQETPTSPLCRFEVFVQDNDRNLAPSSGDFFSIKLSKATVCVSELTCTQLPAAAVFYTRAGDLAGGNLTVD